MINISARRCTLALAQDSAIKFLGTFAKDNQ